MRFYLQPGRQGGRETGDWEHRLLLDLARRHGTGEHHLTDSPEEADAILITDVFFDHHFWRVVVDGKLLSRLNRTYVYCEKGLVSRILPGLMTSMPRRPWDFGRYRTAMYTSHQQQMANPYVEGARRDGTRDLLYAYIGRTSHPLRRRLLAALPDRPDAVAASSDGYEHWDPLTPHREARQKEYAATLARADFVLCPRGWSPSTIRVYEAMQIGRAPVIVSDAWRPPLGPDWGGFAVFVAERDVGKIPHLLTERRGEAGEMGRRARVAWERHFSPQSELVTLLDSLADLHRRRRLNEWVLVPLWPLFLCGIAMHYAGYRMGVRWRARA